MLTQIKILQLIKANKLFEGIDFSSINFAVNSKEVVNVAEGDIVFKSGDNADCIYLVLEGIVKIKHSVVVEGSKIYTRTIEDYFGEKEFLENTTRTSSAVAETPCTLYILRRKEFNQLVEKEITIMHNLQGYAKDEIALLRASRVSQTRAEEIDNLLEQKIKEKQTDETSWDFSPADPQDELQVNYPEQTETINTLDENVFSSGKDEDKNKGLDFSSLIKKAEKPEIDFDENENLGWDFGPGEPESSEFNNEIPFVDESKTDEINVNDFKTDETFQLDSESDEKFGIQIGESELEKTIDEILWGELEPPKDGDFSNSIIPPMIDLWDTQPEKNVLSPETTSYFSQYGDSEKQKESLRPVLPETMLSREQLLLIIQAAEKVNSTIRLEEVLRTIVEAASYLTQADRGTLYIVDRENNELWSKVLQGDVIEEIKLKIGQGLAGWVAKTGEIINIQDVSKDNRFNPEIDLVTGYHTQTMICYPIKNREGIIIGVLQLLNSRRGAFNELDVAFLEALSVHAALALVNADLVQQLLRTDRLLSLGKVANFILCDIKKPILTIKQFAEHIKRKKISDDVMTVLNLIIDQVNTVSDLIQATLNYSEGKTVSRSKIVSLNLELNSILSKLSGFCTAGKVEVIKNFDADVLANIDSKEFYQACYQIVKNACDAMPEGGKLIVSTKIEGDKVLISFKDSGIGIPQSLQDKIFEPFMTQGKKNGIGLGIPIAQKIIRDHNGTLSVESEIGEGATFIFTLPIEK